MASPLVQNQEMCLEKRVQGFSPAEVWGVPTFAPLSQKGLLRNADESKNTRKRAVKTGRFISILILYFF